MQQRFLGRVKFFNQDTGVGFLQLLDTNTGLVVEDVFAHKSEIQAQVPPHLRKLITGEIVSFELHLPQPGKDRNQAKDIRGFLNGPLICDHGEVEFTSYTYIHAPPQPPSHPDGSVDLDLELAPRGL